LTELFKKQAQLCFIELGSMHGCVCANTNVGLFHAGGPRRVGRGGHQLMSPLGDEKN